MLVLLHSEGGGDRKREKEGGKRGEGGGRGRKKEWDGEGEREGETDRERGDREGGGCVSLLPLQHAIGGCFWLLHSMGCLHVLLQKVRKTAKTKS